MVGGSALKAATDAIVERARSMATHIMEVAIRDIEFREGHFRLVGTDRSMPFAAVAQAFYLSVVPANFQRRPGCEQLVGRRYAQFPERLPRLRGGNGPAHWCCMDSTLRGRRRPRMVINPLNCGGQVHGGLAQGIGRALTEKVAYDRNSGQLLTSSFMDYSMPRAGDFPTFARRLGRRAASGN
jgi:carbon-monoxide dehydrogenase large subunit